MFLFDGYLTGTDKIEVSHYSNFDLTPAISIVYKISGLFDGYLTGSVNAEK